MKLTEKTGPDGTVDQIGQIFIDWVSILTGKHSVSTSLTHFKLLYYEVLFHQCFLVDCFHSL